MRKDAKRLGRFLGEAARGRRDASGSSKTPRGTVLLLLRYQFGGPRRDAASAGMVGRAGGGAQEEPKALHDKQIHGTRYKYCMDIMGVAQPQASVQARGVPMTTTPTFTKRKSQSTRSSSHGRHPPARPAIARTSRNLPPQGRPITTHPVSLPCQALRQEALHPPPHQHPIPRLLGAGTIKVCSLLVSLLCPPSIPCLPASFVLPLPRPTHPQPNRVRKTFCFLSLKSFACPLSK